MNYGDAIKLPETGAPGMYVGRKGRLHKSVIEIDGQPAIVLSETVDPSDAPVPASLERIRTGIDMLFRKRPGGTK